MALTRIACNGTAPEPSGEFQRLIRCQEASHQQFADHLATLSDREWQVFERVADGEMNKVIAADLGISERTVEVHRGQVMKKLGVKTLAQLVRFKIESELTATG